MTAKDLCGLHGCRIVHFMYHDRAAFGGACSRSALSTCGSVDFPLRAGEAWAWWALLLSGAAGFRVSWPTWATATSTPGTGRRRWHSCRVRLSCADRAIRSAAGRELLVRRRGRAGWLSATGLGPACLVFAALGVAGAGLTILTIGMTAVFVPQDLAYLGVSPAELRR